MVPRPASWRRITGMWIALTLASGALVAGPRFAAAQGAGEAQERAEELGEPVEVVDLTTPETIVYANPDGTFTAELSSGPVRVADASSPTGWSDIDVSLEQGPEGLKPQATEADITFSDGGAGEAATISEDGLSLAFGSEETLPTPTVSGDTATYAEVRPGIDLTLQARPGASSRAT